MVDWRTCIDTENKVSCFVMVCFFFLLPSYLVNKSIPVLSRHRRRRCRRRSLLILFFPFSAHSTEKCCIKYGINGIARHLLFDCSRVEESLLLPVSWYCYVSCDRISEMEQTRHWLHTIIVQWWIGPPRHNTLNIRSSIGFCFFLPYWQRRRRRWCWGCCCWRQSSHKFSEKN